MPSRKTQVIRHIFGGGWATDFGPTVDASPDQSGKVVIPYLLEAQNTLFELDGGPHKIGGTTKVNSSAVAGGATVTGVYDYWRQGTAGAPARRRILHAGTVCLGDTDDGTFTNSLATGLTSAAVPSYFTFDDLLIFSSDSTTDVPRSWDQSTAQNLAGTPPRFSFGCSHKNRAWAAGVYGQPSRLYYSANVDPEDWVGASSGSIDIDPQDGDMITGLVSHQDSLFVFKGPNKGSIHRITGSSPTGSDAFSRVPFVKGIGACWQNAIFRFGDDIGYVSQYGTIHSLSSTANFGDFISAALSRPINGWLRDHLNYSRLRNIWAATDHIGGIVYITMSVDSSSSNNVVLAMDFRAAPNLIRWSRIPSYALASLGSFVDTSGLRRVLGGGTDGFVKRINMTDRSIDTTTAIAYRVTTPQINYGDPITTKTIGVLSCGIAPKGNFDFTVGWTRDNKAQQTTLMTQGGNDVLGAASAHVFTLDSSTLAGNQYVDRYAQLEEGGEFRSIQYDITQTGLSQDIELHSISCSITPGAISTEADL